MIMRVFLKATTPFVQDMYPVYWSGLFVRERWNHTCTGAWVCEWPGGRGGTSLLEGGFGGPSQ